MKSNKIKILTDIYISQSIEWREKTDNIKELYPDGSNNIEGFDNIKDLLYYETLRCSYHS
jgi:hypothetical protein